MGADSRVPEMVAVLSVFLGLSILFVSLRIYVKSCIAKNFSLDDVFVVIALIFFATYAACGAEGLRHGVGQHAHNVPLTDIPKGLYYWFLCEILYALTTLFVRISIGLFLLRICVKNVHKNIVYVTLASVTAFTIFYSFLVLFQCSPVSYFWGQYEGMQGKCIDITAVPNATIAHSVVSFTADWVLGLLPVALIWNLKMNLRTKISVGVLLSMGLLAGIATMIRIPYVRTLAITNDFTFATTDIVIWSTVEVGLGLMAAGLASLKPLFRTLGFSISTANSRPTRSTRTRSRAIDLHTNQSGKFASKLQSSADTSNVYLGPDVGVRTEIRSPFGDSSEVVRDLEGTGNWRRMSLRMGGGIEKTVEISRVEGDASSVESELRGTRSADETWFAG